MCGIFGYLGTECDVSDLVHRGLKDLEYRGYDSWGIAVARENSIRVAKDVGKLQSLAPDLGASTLAIGHTRWATTGAVTQRNAHPHIDTEHRIAVVHNGIVENADVLRRELLAEGCEFGSETDTEVIVRLVEREFQQGVDTLQRALRRVFLRLEGLNAIAAIDSQRHEMVLARSGSPLVLGIRNEEYFAASDLGALAGQVDRILHLRDGEMATVTSRVLSIYEIATKKRVAPRWENLSWSRNDASLGDHQHYLSKEIEEQPAMLRRMAEEPASIRRNMSELVTQSQTVWLTGCGTAYHAALIGSYLLTSTKRRRARAMYAHELSHFVSTLSEGHLVLSISQSGETIDLLDGLRAARRTPASTAALVNVPGSTLTRMVDEVLFLNAGPEKSVLSTKAYTSMVTSLIAIAAEEGLKLKNTLLTAAAAMETYFGGELAERIDRLAGDLVSTRSLFALGSGVYYPTALEAALKIKEVSYIHAEGFACGELKHGVIALVEAGTPCIIFVPEAGDERSRALVSAQELKARGGRIIGVSQDPHQLFDDYLPIPAKGNAFLLACIVPLQLLAYKLALKKNLDPDKPRNLAKSVTVR